MSDRTEHEQSAYDLGVEHAKNAASWIIDGNTKREFIPAVLAFMDDDDPRADDYLPRRPDLSGEYADDLTPIRLYERITGKDHGDAQESAGLAYETLVGSVVDSLFSAYEEGVDETFGEECERILREAIA